MLERHRHHSVSGVPGDGARRAGARDEGPRYYGTREQVQEADGERDDDEDATNAKQDGERDDDGDATNARRDDERDDDQDAIDLQHDIQARLRRSPDVIVADTWANRPQRTRSAINKYQAGTKTVTKKPGRG